MTLAAVRGVILEELVLHLLGMVGYRTIEEDSNDEGTKKGKSGLEVQGRGESHQIDAVAAFDYTPAFMYPLRLLMEAKCYAEGYPVGIDVVRNAVGVLKDISENYFTVAPKSAPDEGMQIPRFNYQSAIFSTSGYTIGAQRFAIAHQIFLIQYNGVKLFKPLSDGLQGLKKSHFKAGVLDGNERQKQIRDYVRSRLQNNKKRNRSPFQKQGGPFFAQKIIKPTRDIGGSYFGMLQGKWPMHLLSEKPLPAALFSAQDTINCKIYGRNSMTWSFVPMELDEGSTNWFRLEFDLPVEIAEIVEAAKGDKVQIAQVKGDFFSFISLSGLIGSVRRQVRLQLDEEWLQDYIAKASKRRKEAKSLNDI